MRVRVTPKARREAIVGLRALADGGSAIAVQVRAAPEDGAANAAVAALLAQSLSVAKSAVALASGATSRQKMFRIEGDAADLAQRLGQALEAAGERS
ncbi:MAG: hypothetical protein GC199_00675 [Alphaproteobacteria bacterium]|nr:hypothetical protein [Alphaproteobacteria bacterium]